MRTEDYDIDGLAVLSGKKRLDDGSQFIGESLVNRLKVSMRNEESAINLESMVNGLLAFANLSSNAKPAKAFIVEHMMVDRDGKAVAVYLDAPMEETMNLIMKRGE
ncbi:MAG: hypothetical protein ACPGSB_12340 [Opitutales bacterium]